jgi:molybdopterin converting factor small subunit
MRVTVHVFGSLQNYFGGIDFVLILEKGASLRDLLDSIAAQWGNSLPDSVWNTEKRRFEGGIIISDGIKDLVNDEMVLSDDQKIFILMPFAGGSV